MSLPNHSLMRICVHSEKRKFGFIREDEWTHEVHVHVRSKAQNNEANEEIERECAKFFGASVKMVRGEKSPHKVLDIGLGKDALFQRVSQWLKK